MTDSDLFRPSYILTNYFERGIDAAIEMIKYGPETDKLYDSIEAWERKDVEELIPILQKKFLQTIAMMASDVRAHDYEEVLVSTGTALTLPVEMMFSKNFIIRPIDMSTFLLTLREEMYSHLRAPSGIISGSWGEMVIRKRSLVMLMAEQKASIYSPKEKAEVILLQNYIKRRK